MATPHDQIVQYSTQVVYSTNTSPTFLQILNDVDMRLTNTIASSDKIRWINDTMRPIWKYMASTKIYSSTTVSGQAIYAMSTDMRFEKINYVGMSDSTARSSTELYTEYKVAGSDDELSGNQYYKAGAGIGLYPVPTSDEESRGIKIKYEAVPAVYASTTDTTTVPQLAIDYVDIIKFGLARNVALAGNNPDVELGNNYDSDFQAMLRKIKMDYQKRKARNVKNKVSYKEGWWQG